MPLSFLWRGGIPLRQCQGKSGTHPHSALHRHISPHKARELPADAHVLELVSAHRHNRGTSRTSKHWSGHAVDLRVRGVNVKDVRSFVWKMEDPIGLGYYREQQFVHVDWRPVEGKIAWDQRTEGSAYHYHPAWSGGPPKKQKQAKHERPSRRRALRSSKPNS